MELVAATDSTVLIEGETGCGKELFARAVHSRSRRSARPLVKVNCGAIAPGLVESELFGHVKGAFTGAVEKRVGRFELANGGTIFLDEISELPLEAQVKLLRVLQEQEFEPVGSSRTLRVDVRVIAATNRDLAHAVREGKFRPDLLYRLNVFPIAVPPLRDRASDIALLAAFFTASLARKLGKPIKGFNARCMERLMRYAWPGNVRELQNVVERAAILSPGPVLELEGILLAGEAPAGGDPTGPPIAPAPPARDHDRLEEVERSHILSVLKTTGGVVGGTRGAAAILGLRPNTLRSRMKKLGISSRLREAVGTDRRSAWYFDSQFPPRPAASLRGRPFTHRPSIPTKPGIPEGLQQSLPRGATLSASRAHSHLRDASCGISDRRHDISESQWGPEIDLAGISPCFTMR